MHPVARKGLAVGRLRLRDLILVVREHQVFATRMQVERVPEELRGHGGALNMPARSTLAQRRLPALLARLHGLPQREVASRILLVLVDVDARAVFDALKVLLRELPVLVKAVYPEIPGAVLGLVGDVLRRQLLDQSNHIRNAARGTRDLLRTLHSQRIRVLEEGSLNLRVVLLDGASRSRAVSH